MTGLSISQLRDIVEEDFVTGQYYVTGKLTKSIYADDCVFTDPTVNVKGVDPYMEAVAQLFDPAASRADLISLDIEDDHTLKLKWRLAGKLQLGDLSFKPYTGTTLYVTGPDGLISQHTETWDISPVDVFVSLFFPAFGIPPAPEVAS